MATAASLSIKLGLVTATFAKDTKEARAQLDNLQKSVQNLGNQFSGLLNPIKNFGAALGGLGLVALAHQTLAYADTVSDLAAGFSVSVAKVLQFKDALLAAGGDGAKAEQIISKLFNAIGKAQGGDEALIGKFQKLGISFKELASLTPEESLKRITRALADTANGFEKVALARELVGESAAGLDFKVLADAIEESNEKNLRYAYNLEKVKDLFDAGRQSVVNLQIAFAKFFPEIKLGAISVETFEKALKAVFVYFVASRIVGVAVAIGQVTKSIIAAKGAALAFNAVAAKTPIGVILTGVGLAAAGASYLIDKFSDDAKKAAGASGETPNNADQGFEDYKKKQEEIEKLRKAEALERAKTLTRSEVDGAKMKYAATLKQIELEENRLRTLAKIGVESERSRKFVELEFESAKKVLELEKQKGDLAKQYKDKQDILKQEEQTINALIEAEKRRLELAKQIYDNELKIAYAKETQATKARAEFERGRPAFESPEARARGEIDFRAQEEIRTKVGAPSDEGYTEEQQQIIAAIHERAQAERVLLDVQQERIRKQEILTSTESQALSATTANLQLLGQKSAGAFAAYKAFAIAQAIIDTYKGAQAAFTAFAAIPVVGPILGYAAAAAAIAAGLARVSAIRSQQPAGRQSGGPVKAGQPYQVGEAGRELFVPSSNGTIVPNGATEKMLNSGKNVTYQVSINALDARSVDELLSDRPELIYALGQQGQDRVGARSFRG